ncbi:MAG: hypothetical protein GPOALKHO_000644 [Sodalis sp.]|nr:MAG: hypothetical protein GPOALKHO_000644 [Sodalis sp.]
MKRKLEMLVSNSLMGEGMTNGCQHRRIGDQSTTPNLHA